MTPLNSMLQKKEFKSRQPNTGMTGRPSRRRERSQPARLRLRRQSLPTGLPSPMTPCPRLRRQSLPTGLPGPATRSPCHPASLWWEVPGLTAAQCLPGPTVLNTIDHAVVIGADEVLGQKDATTHQGPATHPDVVGVGSGPGPRHREGPALEPGTLTRRKLRGLVVLPEVRPSSSATRHHRHQARSSPDRSTRSGSRQHDRHESVDSLHTCPDERCSCPQQFHRRLRREPSQ